MQASSPSQTAAHQQIDPLPSDSRLPDLDDLFEGVSHYAWAPFPKKGEHFCFRHFGGQLPLDSPGTAWASTRYLTLDIQYDSFHDHLVINDYELYSDREDTILSPAFDSLVEQLVNELDARHAAYEQTRFSYYRTGNDNHLPNSLIGRLKDTFSSLYEFHRHDDDFLRDTIDGLGRNRLDELKHAAPTGSPPTWVVTAVCPRCDCTWKHPFHPTVCYWHSDSFPLEPSKQAAAAYTYCPMCNYHEYFPDEYITDPELFLDTNPETHPSLSNS